MDARVIESVSYRPKDISPLLLIPNVKKSGFRVCHDLHLLNSLTIEEWGHQWTAWRSCNPCFQEKCLALLTWPKDFYKFLSVKEICLIWILFSRAVIYFQDIPVWFFQQYATFQHGIGCNSITS